ncbi:hypothetical protein GBO34_00920 [Roseivirga pacifica]|uniref:hypothetical protein n=1 Tax=Roseivirga pacifica TaxID=1267423 RepID=UPI002095A62E|nr:hypothetical protein [Roseivirga pacifica]MCO6367875.1 hypothetical protein [Roseivirga pacifica]MCO6377247.1 hypothetical protein [Roseivirga pacifica]
MKNAKPILIIGEPETGKTYLAKKVAGSYKAVAYVNGWKFDESSINKSTVTPDTDLLIIDDVHWVRMPKVMKAIKDGVTVCPKFKDPFRISPQIIVTSDSSILDHKYPESLADVFSIVKIETPIFPILQTS